MTFEQAAQALSEAVQSETGREGYGDAGIGATPPAAEAPAESKPAEQPATPVTPEGESEVATPAEPADSFTRLDPTALPQELQPYYKSMQADYVRKTQEVAEARKALEGITDPDEARVALELLHSLGTPEGMLSFHQLLSQNLQTMGLSPAQADAAATQQIQGGMVEAPALPSFEDDPEAALKAQFDGLQGQVAQLQSQLEAERVAAQQESAYYALAGEISRQEALVRQSNPHYTDEHMNAVFNLAPSFGGNLLEAQRAFEEIRSAAVADVLNSKAQALTDTGVQAIGTVGHAETPVHYGSLEQAHEAATEKLRQILAEG